MYYRPQKVFKGALPYILEKPAILYETTYASLGVVDPQLAGDVYVVVCY